MKMICTLPTSYNWQNNKEYDIVPIDQEALEHWQKDNIQDYDCMTIDETGKYHLLSKKYLKKWFKKVDSKK